MAAGSYLCTSGGPMIPAGVVVAPAAGPVLYGFSLGLVAAVNPCGFPLLPAYLMLSAGERERLPFPVRAVRALSAGAAMTAGFVIVFGVLGIAVKVGLGSAAGWVPWIMVPVGVACLAAGGAIGAGRQLRFHLPAVALPPGRGRTVTLVVFGVGYAVASLSCALPLFLVGVADSFARRGVALGLACGLAYALGMGLVTST
jgi:cytochrome c-type biogenesis protein